MLIGFKDPAGSLFVSLSAVQLLWLNLVTDGLPAISLGLDAVSPKAMEKPPRKITDSILSLRFTVQLLLISFIIAAGALLSSCYGLRQSGELAQTMTLTTLVVLEIVRVQMVRSQYQLSHFQIHLSYWLWQVHLSFSFLSSIRHFYKKSSVQCL